MRWMRRDASERKAGDRLLVRLTCAAVLAFAALVAAGAWLTHHPELRPGPCIRYCH